jgi:hypothetical protein
MVYLLVLALLGAPITILGWSVFQYFSGDLDRKRKAGLGLVTFGLLLVLLALAWALALSQGK